MKRDLRIDKELKRFVYWCCKTYGILQHYYEALQEARIAIWQAKPNKNKTTYNRYLCSLVRWHVYQFANKIKGGDHITTTKKAIYNLPVEDLEKIRKQNYNIDTDYRYDLKELVDKTVFTPAEQKIFDIISKNNYTLKEIADITKVTRERVRQLKFRIYYKLKRTVQALDEKEKRLKK